MGDTMNHDDIHPASAPSLNELAMERCRRSRQRMAVATAVAALGVMIPLLLLPLPALVGGSEEARATVAVTGPTDLAPADRATGQADASDPAAGPGSPRRTLPTPAGVASPTAPREGTPPLGDNPGPNHDERLRQCQTEAREKRLVGDERRAFIEVCMKRAPAAAA
jgi:hypothetical protein